MKLQNLKNYLIFLIAVSHMLAFGNEPEEQKQIIKPSSETWRIDSALDTYDTLIELAKGKDEQISKSDWSAESDEQQDEILAPHRSPMFPDFLSVDPQEKSMNSN